MDFEAVWRWRGFPQPHRTFGTATRLVCFGNWKIDQNDVSRTIFSRFRIDLLMLLDDIFNLHQSLSVVKNLHQYGFWMIFSWFLLVSIGFSASFGNYRFLDDCLWFWMIFSIFIYFFFIFCPTKRPRPTSRWWSFSVPRERPPRCRRLQKSPGRDAGFSIEVTDGLWKKSYAEIIDIIAYNI